MDSIGMHTIKLGDIRVTAILDLQMRWDAQLFVGVPAKSLPHMENTQQFAPSMLSIHYFLVETGASRILIDTGTGQKGSRSIIARLAALGLNAVDITHILLTHFHIDHIGGLLDQTRDIHFPNAQIIAHTQEREYWLGAPPALANTSQREQYDFAQQLRPFSHRFTWVQQGQILPGIELVHLPGHTPGHSGFRIRSRGHNLFIIGDIFHQPAVQTAAPEIGTVFDVHPAQAVATRKLILNTSSDERHAGMHTDFPAFGFIQRIDDAYMFTHINADG